MQCDRKLRLVVTDLWQHVRELLKIIPCHLLCLLVERRNVSISRILAPSRKSRMNQRIDCPVGFTEAPMTHNHPKAVTRGYFMKLRLKLVRLIRVIYYRLGLLVLHE